MGINLNITFLADRQDAIPIIAGWLHEEWGNLPPWSSMERISSELQQRLNRNRPPLTIVAFVDPYPVGTASIIVREMEIYPEHLYWIGEVYVEREMRRKGIGSMLIRRTVEIASQIGIKELFMYTPNEASLYAKLGWTELERILYNGEEVTVMRRVIL
jgi:GNAT superfamily N-acetyltransferase